MYLDSTWKPWTQLLQLPPTRVIFSAVSHAVCVFFCVLVLSCMLLFACVLPVFSNFFHSFLLLILFKSLSFVLSVSSRCVYLLFSPFVYYHYDLAIHFPLLVFYLCQCPQPLSFRFASHILTLYNLSQRTHLLRLSSLYSTPFSTPLHCVLILGFNQRSLFFCLFI